MNKRTQRVSGLLILFVLSAFLSYGQGADDAESVQQKRYERGKELYQEGKYDLAMDMFRTLSSTEQNNPYAIYASFYFALSAFQSSDYLKAKDMLQQIKSRYPKWNRMSEVDYWLANTHFELANYKQAFSLLKPLDQQKGTTRATLEDAAKMKQFYLSQVTDVNLLRGLHQEYPDDKVIATQLVERILISGADDDELATLKDSLVQKFNIDESSFGVATQAASIKKDVYNVAAFLPFFANKLSMNDKSNFVLEMYQGMRMAADELQNEGLNVQLYAYDTERDYDVTKRLLEKPEAKVMDVIMGPLYPGPFRAISEFTQEQQVYMINPVSSNPLVVSGNPFSFLMQPSTLTEARRAAQYAADTLGRKMAIVVTDESPRDSARVNTFVKNFKQDDSYEIFIQKLKDYNTETMESFADTLVYFSEQQEEQSEAPPVVYVASNNDLAITNTISAVVMANTPLTLFGNDQWFDITSVTYEQLEELDVHFLSPAYIDYQRRTVQKFTEAYKQRYNALPTKFAYAGYDAMYYVGQMLNEFGIYFQEFYTQDKPVNSMFYEGYNFYEANDNQLIPIIRFEEGILQAVEPTSE